MASNAGVARVIGTWIAVALLATGAGCGGGGGGDSEPLTGTCSPTTQTAPDPGGAAGFCNELYGVVCDRGFTDCIVEFDLTGTFGSAAECKAFFGFLCAQDFSNYWYDAPCGASCIAYARSSTCSAFVDAEPQACSAALGEFAVAPPACTTSISPGTLTDTITASDPVYDGGYARVYCITFTAGQSVTIRTEAPATGTPIDDSVLHLFDPTGAQIAVDDDSGTSFYSLIAVTIPATGQYRIVVRGFSTGDVGSYQLIVTAG